MAQAVERGAGRQRSVPNRVSDLRGRVRFPTRTLGYWFNGGRRRRRRSAGDMADGRCGAERARHLRSAPARWDGRRGAVCGGGSSGRVCVVRAGSRGGVPGTRRSLALPIVAEYEWGLSANRHVDNFAKRTFTAEAQRRREKKEDSCFFSLRCSALIRFQLFDQS